MPQDNPRRYSSQPFQPDGHHVGVPQGSQQRFGALSPQVAHELRQTARDTARAEIDDVYISPDRRQIGASSRREHQVYLDAPASEPLGQIDHHPFSSAPVQIGKIECDTRSLYLSSDGNLSPRVAVCKPLITR